MMLDMVMIVVRPTPNNRSRSVRGLLENKDDKTFRNRPNTGMVNIWDSQIIALSRFFDGKTVVEWRKGRA
ncbi:hypothetical protein [Sphingomonas paeninsulae]|uniref:hypothetical protein n=1 Tax=Sphingomonas paeninsulae TaxID=2319844 RepID=UPI0019691A69|nr:hypothetical protein [Sphingomonas paeninsulae]